MKIRKSTFLGLLPLVLFFQPSAWGQVSCPFAPFFTSGYPGWTYEPLIYPGCTLNGNPYPVGGGLPLNEAVMMKFTPDGRLFLAERISGNIRVFENGVLNATPWFTVPGVFSGGTESGLVGIEIDPNFINNGYVYVYYTIQSPTPPSQYSNIVARIQEVNGFGQNLTQLNTTPESRIAGNIVHNGGAMTIGHDGMLYLATGEGNYRSLAEDITRTEGKVLRAQLPNFTPPPDNPFVGIGNPYVYTWGHRNTYSLAVHPVTGQIWQGENGWVVADELNLLVRGANYGWPWVEANSPCPTTLNPAQAAVCAISQRPKFTWNPQVVPTGMSFNTGSLLPAGFLNQLFLAGGTAGGPVLRIQLSNTSVSSVDTLSQQNGYSLGAVMGPDGLIYKLHIPNVPSANGRILVRFSPPNLPLVSANLTAVSNKAVGGSITYGFRAPAGSMIYAWASFSRLGSPITTPYGLLTISPESALPVLTVNSDGRAFLGRSIANNPALIGRTVYTQALVITPSGEVHLTNEASLVLR